VGLLISPAYEPQTAYNFQPAQTLTWGNLAPLDMLALRGLD